MIPIKGQTYLIDCRDGDYSYKGKAIFTGEIEEDKTHPKYTFYEFKILEGELAGDNASFFELDIAGLVEEKLPEPENLTVAAKPFILIEEVAGSVSITISWPEDDDETFTIDQEDSYEKLAEVFEALGFKCGYWMDV